MNKKQRELFEEKWFSLIATTNNSIEKEDIKNSDLAEVYLKTKEFYDFIEDTLDESFEESDKLNENICLKVGDFIISTSKLSGSEWTGYIDSIDGSLIEGFFYKREVSEMSSGYAIVQMKNARIATDADKREYEEALVFHHHGRKPFKVEVGDMLANILGQKFIVESKNWSKEDFINGNYSFIATKEEIKAWAHNQGEYKK